MNPWIPFDADDDEIAQLHVIREGIPTSLRPALLAWIHDELPSGGYVGTRVTPDMIHMLEGALGLRFGLSPKAAPPKADVISTIDRSGDRMVLRVVDYLASRHAMDGYGNVPSRIDRLGYFLDLNRSAFEVYRSDVGTYRLRSRLPEGTEELVQTAIDLDARPGRHLANAWSSAYGLEPNESFAMTEAIRAVEAAAAPVVTPKDKKPTLGKIVSVMRDQGGWGLVLHDSEGFPDHGEVIIGMLETLAKAQTDRHAGDKPSPLEAQAHAQLAATLVSWFGSGAVVRKPIEK